MRNLDLMNCMHVRFVLVATMVVTIYLWKCSLWMGKLWVLTIFCFFFKLLHKEKNTNISRIVYMFFYFTQRCEVIFYCEWLKKLFFFSLRLGFQTKCIFFPSFCLTHIANVNFDCILWRYNGEMNFFFTIHNQIRKYRNFLFCMFFFSSS